MTDRLSQIVRPFDVIQDIPSMGLSRLLHPKDLWLWPVQAMIIAKQHLEFRGVKCHGKNATHILMAAGDDLTFEWTTPTARYAPLSNLEGHHIRVLRYHGYDWTKDAIDQMHNWYDIVLSDPELADYDEGEYFGHLLELGLGEIGVTLVGSRGYVCSSGAAVTSIYVHKMTGAPRFFRRPVVPPGELEYLPAEAATPAHFSCWRKWEFDCVYDEPKARI